MPTRITRPRIHTVARFLLAGVLIASLAPTASVGAASTVSVVAVADSSVRLRSPGGNYGSADTLRLRGTIKDQWRAYVRFDLGPLDGEVADARLRLWVTDASAGGGEVYAVDPGWGELTITWSSAPAIAGSPLDSIGAVSVGTWVEFDVSAAVTGSGTHSFALKNTSGDSVLYSSREGVAPPQLVVTTVAAPPSPPVAGFSAAPVAGTGPLTVTFADTSTGSPTTWAWDFDNDGTVDSTVQHPVHTYSTPGLYSVALTASNTGGPDTLVQADLITVASAGGGATLSFVPVADAHVRSGSPSSNYGSATTLRLRQASDSYEAYLKFSVSGITSPVVSAMLRLYVTDPSWAGGSVYVTGTSWAESTITWSNAPSFAGTALDTVGSVVAGTWVELDVTGTVSTNGTYGFGLDSPAGDSVLYSSKEGAQPPELVVVTSSSGTPPAPTAEFSATPTSGGAPLTVAFRDESVGIVQAWAWDFQSDGIIDSTSRHTSFNYTTAGTYSVRLTVTNAGGSNTITKTNLIVVAAPPPPGPNDAVLVGAGDIAGCSSIGDEATAEVLDGIPGNVFTTGDNAYETGTSQEFANCYEPSWGRHRTRTRPSPGNHDYGSAGAAPYFAYFGANAGQPGEGYYSYDLGEWHVVVLNSNCGEIGGCDAGSPQEAWLRADLAASQASCTLAYWHHPLFSSGQTAGSTTVRALWQALEDGGAEVVLNGHAHVYERFAPQTVDGIASPSGIRQFTVGTGGKSLSSFGTVRINSEIRNALTFGVLELTLRSTGYLWAFVPVAGWTGGPIDAGSATCH